MSDDAQLLRQFAEESSQDAFRQLVERHLPLVNSTARRVLAGDVHLAQDVTQVVFTDLARKAGTLPTGVVLGGWLYRHTCYTALKAIRSENRRRARERIAMEINALNESSAGDAHWLQLAPVLDDALNQLGAEDRDAIVLRYLQQQDVRSIGRALGASENAAQKRLGRALEKLRAILTRQGVTVSSALLATALDAGAATAPLSAGLAASISTNALVGAAATATTTTLLTTLNTMITTKLAFGVAAAIVAVGATTVIIQQNGATTPTAPAQVAQTATSITPAKAPVTVITAAAKVETPKVAPAPAGGGAVPADDTAVSAEEIINGRLTTSGTGVLTFSSSDPFASETGGGSITLSQATIVGTGTLTLTKDANGADTTVPGAIPPSAISVSNDSRTDSTVLTYTDGNGVVHTEIRSPALDANGTAAGGAVPSNATLILNATPVGSASGGNGAVIILSNGPANP